MNSSSASVVLVMGVSGSGKTTVGKLLAAALGWQFADADDFHSATSIAKMHRGSPLTDADRQPWLVLLQSTIAHWLQTDTSAVLACSALKAEYRAMLTQGNDRVQVVYLQGSYNLIRQRLQQRQGHYMNPDLLASQFATLEIPADSLPVEIDQTPEAIVQAILAHLRVNKSFRTER